ncbi:MAG: hypothetical protein HYS13_16320 [Planctomycetia bacterium]|nr:hypothetical protein [Planctomycetia bacterium]
MDWSIDSVFIAEPRRVFIQRVGESLPIEREVAISRVDGREFRITGVVTSDGALSASVDDSIRATSHKVTVHLNGIDAQQQVFLGKVELHTDYEAQPILRIPVIAVR